MKQQVKKSSVGINLDVCGHYIMIIFTPLQWKLYKIKTSWCLHLGFGPLNFCWIKSQLPLY